MPTARKRIAVSLEREIPPIEDYRARPAQEIYGKLVFNDAAQKQFLSKDVYKKLRATTLRGQPIDASIADQVAQGMREWALAHGASHYTHWFVPMTGLTAEKHDAFIEPAGAEGGCITEFVGKTLVRGEPDASSFPSGGTRATFEARGYTVWDPSSPAFIQEEVNGATLTIPTAFVSYTTEALDQKTPLLRSIEALSTQAVRLLRLFGNKSTTRVFTTLGPEQEYFLIDRKYYELRPDLIACGRTLFGAAPYRGQELEDHYFGAIRERILAFMMDLDRELWKLGIPAKTRHNEVAPAQFELAPMFERSALSADHNMLVMELMRRIALRHDLVCLLHEKPFAGINGSGKHNNWSLSTEDENLLEPGKTPHANAQFLAFLVATIAAVDEYAGLMRIAVSGPGNDHRLGANEAPPAIISVYLGEQLEDIINQLETGTPTKSLGGKVMELGVTTLPAFPMDATDRNRTSPFAFTGNKFEFRAVGSSQPCYFANTVLNTAAAKSIQELVDELEKAPAADFNKALTEALRARIKAHKKVLFSGNNYSEEWHAEAAKRGLPNLKDTVECLKAAHSKKFAGLFESYKVLSAKEYEARIEIFWERYVKVLNIEATATIDIARNQILPAVIAYQTKVAQSLVALKGAGVEVPAAQLELLNRVAQGAAALKTGVDSLESALDGASTAELTAQGESFRDKVIPVMLAVRKTADGLESVVEDDLWPLPKYREMLFQY